MKTLTAVSAFALMVAPAMAADVYTPGGLKDVPAIVVAPTWTGFYLGGNAGGGWAAVDFNGVELGSDSGFVGGGQVGYNFQINQFVLGIESDIGVVSMSQLDSNATMLIDVTGRLGYAAGPALFYAKGGWAYLDTLNGLDGWTVGGGIEYKFNPSWSVKAEYQYFDFFDIGGVTGLDLTANVAKVGLNYHIGAAQPALK